VYLAPAGRKPKVPAQMAHQATAAAQIPAEVREAAAEGLIVFAGVLALAPFGEH
jgi:hypothetical protein